MSPVAQALTVGLPITAVVLVCVYVQKLAWRRPPADARAAELRAAVSMMLPMPQLGIRVGVDRFIYAATGRCLGPLDGATLALAPSTPVSSVKPGTGWATITFADGTTWRHAYPMRNMVQVVSQQARFDAMAKATPPGLFKRTRPAHMTP